MVDSASAAYRRLRENIPGVQLDRRVTTLEAAENEFHEREGHGPSLAHLHSHF